MRQRIITAIWGIPLLIAIIWFGKPWFSLLVAAGACLGTIEFYALGTHAGFKPLTLFGLTWTLLFVLNAHLKFAYTAHLLTSAVIFSLIWTLCRSPKQNAFANWAWTLSGILYVGWMLSHYAALRELSQGKEWVFLAFFSTFACDTAAFFVGRAWGKHQLSPTISPHKTKEGAVGGLAASIAAALLLATGLKLPLSYAQAAALGALIGIFAQLGDLLESLLKRNAGVKDSGSLLPGHGGILDRIDSLLFTGVVVYYYLLLHNAGWLNWL